MAAPLTDRPILREMVALFDDPQRLEAAVSDLQGSGFDRADISFVAHEELAQRPSGSARLAADLATRREAPVTDTDIRQERLLGTSLAATVAAFAAAGFAVALGAVAAPVVAGAAVIAGAGAGAVGAVLGRRLGRDEAAYLDEQVARGGVLLWVRVPDPAAEQRAREIMGRYASHVQVHEFPADPHQPLPSDDS